MKSETIHAAIIGPGNIGLDLMYKIIRRSRNMNISLMVGNRNSTRLHIAQEAGVVCSDKGIEAILERDDIKIVFDATLASAHMEHAPKLMESGKIAIDLTPAAVGKYVCCIEVT